MLDVGPMIIVTTPRIFLIFEGDFSFDSFDHDVSEGRHVSKFAIKMILSQVCKYILHGQIGMQDRLITNPFLALNHHYWL